MPNSAHRPVTTRLVVTDSCPHCKNTLAILDRFVEQGLASKPEIINLTQNPERAEPMGVRAVPWLQLEDLIFEGTHTQSELREWIERIQQPDYHARYLGELLESGRLPLARRWLADNPAHWQALISLAEDPKTPMASRIGIGVLFEENEGKELLRALAARLIGLCQHADARVRADGCYFLSLTHDPQARQALEHCLQDTDENVREIAEEALEKLG